MQIVEIIFFIVVFKRGLNDEAIYNKSDK